MSRNFVLSGLLLIAVSYGFARFAYGLYLPEIRDELMLTPTIAGIVGSGSYLGYCVAILASSFAVARFGPRRVALAAGLVACLGMFAIAMSTSAIVLAAAVLFAGTSAGLASPPMADAVSTVVEPSRQNASNTIINSGTSAGIALSGPVALIASGHWREAYLAFAIVAAVASAWIAFTVPAATAVGKRGVARATRKASMKRLVRFEAVPVIVAAAGMGFASAACWLFGREIMVEIGDLDASATSIAWIVLGVAGFTGAVAGTLVKRFGIVPVHITALLGLSLGTLMLAMLPGSLVVVFASVALVGAAYIMLTGVYLVWGVGVYPDMPAIGLGLPFLMIAVGQVAGGPVAGLLIGNGSYLIAFSVLAGVGLASALIRPARPGGMLSDCSQQTAEMPPSRQLPLTERCGKC